MTRKMKDSGVEWIGTVPDGWNTFSVFQIFSQVDCKNDGVKERNLLSLSYGKIKRKDIESTEGLLPESFDGYNIIEAGDIVLRLTDLQNDQKSLRVGYSRERGIVTSAYLTIRNKSENSSEYLYYYWHTFDVCKGFYGLGAGVRQGLNWNGMKNLRLTLPQPSIQNKIVELLNKRCAAIDDIIVKTIASIDEYKKLKQAVITEAVTKGVRDKRPMKDSGVDWIGQIPKEWYVDKFGRMAHVKANLVPPEKYLDFIQIAPDNIEKGSARLLDNLQTVREVGVISDNHLFYKGQILYSKIRPLLNKVVIAPFDGLCCADMYPLETDCVSKFVVYTILSHGFESQVGLVTGNRVKMPKYWYSLNRTVFIYRCRFICRASF